MALYGLPTFRSPNRGTLAVTRRGDSPRLLTFVSRDGGRRWLPAAELALPAGDYDEPVPAVLSASGRVLALAAQGSVTFATEATPRNLPLAPQDSGRPAPGGARAVSVCALSLTDDGSCWALVAEGGCEEGFCRQVARLLAADPHLGRPAGPLHELRHALQLHSPTTARNQGLAEADAAVEAASALGLCAGTPLYYDQWIFVGTYFFAANGGEYVELVDATGEAGSTDRQLGFDAVKFEK